MDDIRRETGGRVETRVYAQNNNVPGSDPQALRMLVDGEIEFFTLMGGFLDRVVPVTAVQDMPFACSAACTRNGNSSSAPAAVATAN